MTAIKRDGTELNIGDEVEVVGYHKSCNGNTFIVCEITAYQFCESGFMVVVHLKGEPDRKLLGFKKEGHVFQDGLDANYFRKIIIV